MWYLKFLPKVLSHLWLAVPAQGSCSSLICHNMLILAQQTSNLYLWLSLFLCVQTEIERLKRQIAEKEAAKKAARAQTPSVTKVRWPHFCFLFGMQYLKVGLLVMSILVEPSLKLHV